MSVLIYNNLFDIRAFALQKSHDVRFTCESKVAPNGDVEVVLAAKNDSTASRRVTVVMCATARYYTGVQAEELDEKKTEVDLGPGQRMYIMFLLTYLRHLVSGHILFHQV